MDNSVTLTPGTPVRIVPEWCDRPEEANALFVVVEDRDTRVLIADMDHYWNDRTFRPQSAVEKRMIVLA